MTCTALFDGWQRRTSWTTLCDLDLGYFLICRKFADQFGWPTAQDHICNLGWAFSELQRMTDLHSKIKGNNGLTYDRHNMVFMRDDRIVYRWKAEDGQDLLLRKYQVQEWYWSRKWHWWLWYLYSGSVLCDPRRRSSMVRLNPSIIENWHYTDPKLAGIPTIWHANSRAIETVLRQNILASSRPTGKGRSEMSRQGRLGE